MKQFLILCAFAASLTGCPGGSGSNNGGPAGNVNPKAIPANPAPMSYFSSKLNDYEKSKKIVPQNETIFDAVIENDEVKPIDDLSVERKEAVKMLNDEGQYYLEFIKSRCVVQNAKKTESESGNPGTAGATHKVNLSMSMSGTTCPYVVTSTVENLQVLNKLDENSGAFEIQGSSKKVSSTNIVSSGMAKSAGYKSAKIETITSGLVAGNFKQNGEVPVKMELLTDGSVKIVLANDEVLEGPIYGKTIIENKESETQLIWMGKSPAGDVNIGFISKSGQTPEIYYNGQKIDSGSLNNSMGVQAILKLIK